VGRDNEAAERVYRKNVPQAILEMDGPTPLAGNGSAARGERP
jgi:hypothetical protein